MLNGLLGGRRAAWLAVAFSCAPLLLQAQPIPVRHPEVPERSALALSTLDGRLLGDGELVQTVSGAEVTTRLVLRFRDGSLHDETVVFSQEGEFRLVRDRLVQRGPAFPGAIEMSIDGASGVVKVRYAERGGTARAYEERLALPANLANGFVPMALKNLARQGTPQPLSLIVATPRPRLVRLAVRSAIREALPSAAGRRLATHFVLKAEIGGIAGWLAPLVGKRPPDSHVWIVDGDPPSFARSEQPLYVGGPPWRIVVTPGLPATAGKE